jgi:hypothetical protein
MPPRTRLLLFAWVQGQLLDPFHVQCGIHTYILTLILILILSLTLPHASLPRGHAVTGCCAFLCAVLAWQFTLFRTVFNAPSSAPAAAMFRIAADSNAAVFLNGVAVLRRVSGFTDKGGVASCAGLVLLKLFHNCRCRCVT